MRPYGTTCPRWIHLRSVAGLTPTARAASAVFITFGRTIARLRPLVTVLGPTPRRPAPGGWPGASIVHHTEGLLPTVWQQSLRETTLRRFSGGTHRTADTADTAVPVILESAGHFGSLVP